MINYLFRYREGAQHIAVQQAVRALVQSGQNWGSHPQLHGHHEECVWLRVHLGLRRQSAWQVCNYLAFKKQRNGEEEKWSAASLREETGNWKCFSIAKVVRCFTFDASALFILVIHLSVLTSVTQFFSIKCLYRSLYCITRQTKLSFYKAGSLAQFFLGRIWNCFGHVSEAYPSTQYWYQCCFWVGNIVFTRAFYLSKCSVRNFKCWL